jgi:hypothetical protein
MELEVFLVTAPTANGALEDTQGNLRIGGRTDGLCLRTFVEAQPPFVPPDAKELDSAPGGALQIIRKTLIADFHGSVAEAKLERQPQLGYQDVMSDRILHHALRHNAGSVDIHRSPKAFGAGNEVVLKPGCRLAHVLPVE